VRVIHPADSEGAVAAWTAAVSEGKEFSGEFRFVGPQGITGWVCVRSAPLLSDTGVSVGHVGTVEDRTAHKVAEEAHLRLLEAEQQAKQRTAFLAEAGTALASSLDYQETLAKVVWQAVPVLADWCVLDWREMAFLSRSLTPTHPARSWPGRLAASR
jgi:hypothetical protein